MDKPVSKIDRCSIQSVALGLAVFVLSACGGGGSGEPPSAAPITQSSMPRGTAPTAARFVSGVFGGTLRDERDYEVLYVTMGDGVKVGFFGTDWSHAFRFVDYWVSTDSAWTWTSIDGTRSGRFNAGYRGLPAYVDVRFDVTVPSLSGSILAGQLTTTTASFEGGPIQGTSYEFSRPISIAAVVGSWSLVDSAGNPMAVDIAPNGKLNGSYLGCGFKGSVAVSGSENALVVSFDFDASVASCAPALENSTGYRGFAIALPMTSGATRLAFWAGSNDGWNWITFATVGQR